MKLKVCRFGFAMGLIGGLGMLFMAWFGWWFGWALPMTKVISSAYLGMAPSFLGGIFGLVWGFIDFFIFGALVACVYNYCAKCCNKSCE